MNSSTAGAKSFSPETFSPEIRWTESLASIARGRVLLAGLLGFQLALVGLRIFFRLQQGESAWKSDDVLNVVTFFVPLILVGFQTAVLTTETVKVATFTRAKPWSRVRRAEPRDGYILLHFGKWFWNREWLLLPRDPYDRARVMLLLEQRIPQERIVQRA